MDLALAHRIKQATNVRLTIPGFSGKLPDFQRAGIAWLYAIQRGILADQCGLGKTIQALGLLQLLKHRHELNGRALILVPAASIYQWRDEARRFTTLDVGIILSTTQYRFWNAIAPPNNLRCIASKIECISIKLFCIGVAVIG